MRSLLVMSLLVGCAGPPKAAPPAPKPVATKPAPEAKEEPLPPHLANFPGLYVRKGEQIVDAPAADVAVAKSYPRAKEKGPVIDGHRLTLLTAKRTYRVGEEIRVIHVHEIVEPGGEIFVMGPKPIHGEYVGGKLVTPADVADVDPFVPDVYDGPVLKSPAVDYNWEITSYRFSAAGTKTIQWRLGKYASNALVLDIVP